MVLSVDAARKRISLSMKQIENLLGTKIE